MLAKYDGVFPEYGMHDDHMRPDDKFGGNMRDDPPRKPEGGRIVFYAVFKA